ncbi:MAG: TIR domain-containing protein [Alphaproteobacteria bacterium]
MSDIFISYAREDQPVAQRFADAFKAAGLGVWWDTALQAGESFDLRIEAAIRAAKGCRLMVAGLGPVALGAGGSNPRRPAEDARPGAHWRLRSSHHVRADPHRRSHALKGDASDKAWLAFLADVRRLVAKDRDATQTAPIHTITPAPVPAALRGEAPSLAVLPFTNRSGLAEDDVFAIGMVEDVIDALSQGVNVRVIASSATARFRTGAIPDLEAMARQMGVRYILEGNVRRAGANLRVTAQLVEAATGAVLWTRKFDRPLTELAALQEEFVLEVTAHLDAQVYRLEMERALKKPADLTAWEAVTRSFAALRQMTGQSMAVAIEEGQRAIAIAPDYGPGHAMLATSLALRYHYLRPDDAVEKDSAKAHVLRALALDPSNAFVLGLLAQGLCLLGDASEGLRHAERAAALSPQMAFAWHARGTACILLDRFDEGIAHFDVEMKLSPGAHTHYLSLTWQSNGHVRARRWDKAEEAMDRALVLNPDFNLALVGKAFLCRRCGRAAEARGSFLRARQAEPSATLALWELRLRRRFVRNSVVEELIEALRALWAETEPAA